MWTTEIKRQKFVGGADPRKSGAKNGANKATGLTHLRVRTIPSSSNFDRSILERHVLLPFQYLRGLVVPSDLFELAQSIPASGPTYFRHSPLEATNHVDKFCDCLLVRLYMPILNSLSPAFIRIVFGRVSPSSSRFCPLRLTNI